MPSLNNRPFARIRRGVLLSLVSLIFGAGAPARSETSEEGMAKMTAVVRAKFPGVPQVNAAELAAWLEHKKKAPPQLLDVREPEEFAVSHLRGAINISPEASVAEAIKKIDPERPVVVYCSVGYRSSKFGERLIAAGVKNVSNLEGSIFAWANEGRPLEKDGKPTTLVHPYNATYGRLLKPEHRAK